MNYYRLVTMASTLLALTFFSTVTLAEANFPALIVHCGFSVLPPTELFHDHVRKTPTFYIPGGEKICYACPATNEYEQEVANRSQSQRILFIRDLGVSLLHLDQPMPSCESRVRPTIRKRIDKPNHCVEYEVGFQALRMSKYREALEGIDFKKDRDLPFNELLRIYFDGDSEQTISAINYIARQNFLSTASSSKTNLEYEKNENLLKTDLDRSYLHFREQILPRMEAEYSKNPFAHELGIEKIQLVPKDDYVLDTWKIVTYLDINTAPVWRILLMKWNAVEIFVRKVGKMLTGINVETGTTGTLELVEKYYQQNDPPTNPESRLRLPKYVWKIVTLLHNGDTMAILIIMHNDPFTEHQEPLCVDICASNGWFVTNKDYQTGTIYCCQVTEQITEFLNSNKRREYKILNLTDFDSCRKKKLSEFLSGVHEEVYDW